MWKSSIIAAALISVTLVLSCATVKTSDDTARAEKGGPELRISSGEYMGHKWHIDENHMMWWDGEPFVPFGANIGTISEVDIAMSKGLNDFCKNDKELYEYYCGYFANFGDGTPDGYYGTPRLYTCPNGCKDGACIGTAPPVSGDFVVKAISFIPENPKSGDKVQIIASIYNSGHTEPVQVHFMVNGNIIGPAAYANIYLDEGGNNMYKDYTFYSDSARANSIDAQAITSPATTHRYLAIGMSYNDGTAGPTFTGTIENVDLTGTAAPGGSSEGTSMTFTGCNMKGLNAP